VSDIISICCPFGRIRLAQHICDKILQFGDVFISIGQRIVSVTFYTYLANIIFVWLGIKHMAQPSHPQHSQNTKLLKPISTCLSSLEDFVLEDFLFYSIFGMDSVWWFMSGGLFPRFVVACLHNHSVSLTCVWFVSVVLHRELLNIHCQWSVVVELKCCCSCWW